MADCPPPRGLIASSHEARQLPRQFAKLETGARQEQVVPCRAGRLTGVVYANGDVSLCETHPPLGNLRQRSFRDIWFSPEAQQLRGTIARGECYCTNEIFMWPSIVFHPTSLVKAMIRSHLPGAGTVSTPVPVKP